MAETPVSAKDAVGRAKEAAGDLTGNDEIKREGKVDQAGEHVKSTVDKIADKAKELLHKD
jgi:uncharacterized protein YjbJ (UPF0337 family)